jgi:hypothetical protein
LEPMERNEFSDQSERAERFERVRAVTSRVRRRCSKSWCIR